VIQEKPRGSLMLKNGMIIYNKVINENILDKLKG